MTTHKPIATVTLTEDDEGIISARVVTGEVAFVSQPWVTVDACLAHVGRLVNECRQERGEYDTDPRAWVV